jgi:DNA-binding HxlR family transcriptional regulator
MINKVYEGFIVTCLSMSDHPMRCKEIAEAISDRSDFPTVTPQFVSRRMMRLLDSGEIVRIEECTIPKRRTVYFAISGEDEDEDMEDVKITLDDKSSLIEGIVGGHKAFAISEDGKITKLF